jgi:hypothetical protein
VEECVRSGSSDEYEITKVEENRLMAEVRKKRGLWVDLSFIAPEII